ncbi:hypothetical protein RRF57_011351 [Xylaria bambusicola]|uniref:Uncharacterized protein n=1 Tax=Xylaria bambusicola TaxID=326684 RepID=A0AAN7V2L7_9PEZI
MSTFSGKTPIPEEALLGGGQPPSKAYSLFRELAQRLYNSGDVAHAVDNQFQIAQSLLAQSKHEAARLAFRTVIDGGFEGKVVPNVISQSHYLLGHSSYHRKAYQEAAVHFDQALNYPGGGSKRSEMSHLSRQIKILCITIRRC